MFDETDFKITDGLEHHKKFKQLWLQLAKAQLAVKLCLTASDIPGVPWGQKARNTVRDSAAKEPHDSKEGGTGALVELVELVKLMERVHLHEQHWTAVVQL